MAGVFGTTPKTSAAIEQLTDMSVQTSAYGRCIPVIYGAARVAGNVIFYGGFEAVAASAPRTGKGGGGAGAGGQSYDYYADVIWGICEGPVNLARYWNDKDAPRVMFDPTYPYGTASQEPWPGLAERHPGKALGYGSTAVYGWMRYPLTSNASLPSHSYEVYGFHSRAKVIVGPDDPPWTPDANPADVLLDMLTDPTHGMGLPASAIDAGGLADYRQYARAAGLMVSAAIETQRPAAEVVKGLLECTNAMAIWSGGKLRVKPLGDLPIYGRDGNVMWEPDSTPIYTLGPDDFLVGGPDDDPVQVTRGAAMDAYNSVRVTFKDRAADYAESVAEANDMAMQDLYGVRPASDFAADFIADAGAAQTLAQLMLQRHVGIRNEYKFKLGWRYALLDPGDLVVLTDYGLGLDAAPVRLTAVEEDEEGDLEITAVDWPYGMATAVMYPPPPHGDDDPDADAPPGDCREPFIFEPPADYTGGAMRVMVGTSGGPDWGGCEIHASRDGSTYRLVGRIDSPARHGMIEAAIANEADAVNVNMLGGGPLLGASQADADKWETLSCIEGEMVSYRDAVLLGASNAQFPSPGPGAGRYGLTALRRALYSTPPRRSHPARARFMRLDESVASIDIDRWDAGETMYLKFPSFNKRGRALQSLADVDPVAYEVTGAGMGAWVAPSNVAITI
jgi:hypothetical protein